MYFSLSATVFLFYLVIITCKGNKQNLRDGKTDIRLGDLEKKVAASNEKYRLLEERLNTYARINTEALAELKTQREESKKRDDVIKSLKKQLGNVQDKADSFSSLLRNNEPVAKGVKNYTINGDTALLNRPVRFALDQGEAVAFHAVVDTNGEVHHQGINQNIIFGTVLLNINSGYSSRHGIFTAPTAGLYMFSTSVLDAGSKPLIHADMVKNGNVLARAYGHGNSGYPEQGSVTVVTQLQTGDEVWVRLSCCADGSITGLRYTSFTGALIMYI